MAAAAMPKAKEPANNRPVDRGWAWFVLAGAIYNHFVMMCLAKSSGVVFDALQEYYETSALFASCMQALMGGISFFGAPLFCALGDACTVRYVTFLAALFMCIGGAVAFLGTSIYSVVLPFGILGGTGIGMAVSNAPMIVSRYFDRRRALANALLFSGSGLAGIVGPPALQLAIVYYGMPDIFLITGGFLLQVAIGAALYRPMSFWVLRPAAPQDDDRVDKTLRPLVAPGEERKRGSLPPPPEARRQTSVPTGGTTRTATATRTKRTSRTRESKTTTLRPMDDSDTELQQDTTQETTGALERQRILSIQRQASDDSTQASSGRLARFGKRIYVSSSDIFMESMLDLPASATRDTRTVGEIVERQKRWWHPGLVWNYMFGRLGWVAAVCNWSLLCDPALGLYYAACALSCSGFFVAMVTPARCKELGLTKYDTRILLIVMGASETVGRIVVAVVGDLKWVRPRHADVMAGLMLGSGVLTVAVAWFESFASQATYLALCPALWGGNIAMHVTLLTDLCGVDKLANALGLFMFVEGLVVMTDPLVIGGLRDVLGSYVPSYVFIGAHFLLSGALLLALGCVLRRRKRTGAAAAGAAG